MTIVNGAKVSRRKLALPTRSVPSKPPETSDAYALARANQHKGWAKRWLRAHGHWL